MTTETLQTIDRAADKVVRYGIIAIVGISVLLTLCYYLEPLLLRWWFPAVLCCPPSGVSYLQLRPSRAAHPHLPRQHPPATVGKKYESRTREMSINI